MGPLLLCCPLARWIINTPAALPASGRGAGSPARAHLHPLQWQQGPSVHQTCLWKNLFWEINTHTRLQPQSGPGSKVKEPRFLSRQTGAQRHLLTSTQSPPLFFFSLFAEQQRMAFLMHSCVYDSLLAGVAHLGANLSSLFPQHILEFSTAGRTVFTRNDSVN